MRTQFGELVSGDFKENTLTIEINGDMEIRAGRYAIMPIDDYDQLVRNRHLSDIEERFSVEKAIKFKSKNGKYLDKKGNEITTEMIMKHSHYIHDDFGVVFL